LVPHSGLTLRQFIEKARRDYGIEIERRPALLAATRFLRKDGKAFAILIEEDDVLTVGLLRSLCRFYGLPPLDFGLDPDEDDD